MENTEHIIMIVRWECQRRQIKININDDLNAIKEKINLCYQLQQTNDLHEYQIQYYDSTYQNFMDLYPESFGTFQQHLRKLCSPEAPQKSTKEWILKIVHKTVQTTRRTIRESISDDTYNYQQENDPINLLQVEESITTNVRSPALPDRSSTNNFEALPEDPLSQNTDEDEDEDEGEQEIAQSQRPSTANPQILITTDHPYGLGFDGDLADRQRQQYEKDMSRSNSSKSAKSGVRLRACAKLAGTSSSDISYPIVHFEIPSDKHNLRWFIVLCILTEADINGAHYLHSSKGIYHGETTRESRCGTIRDSESVNPYVVQLAADHIRDGKFEILIKVCNMRDLPTRKKEQLREYSRSSNPKHYDQLTLSSTNTMHALKFASERYHLGCTLICEEIIHDQCISNVTTAVTSQKRNDHDQTSPQNGVNKKKKS